MEELGELSISELLAPISGSENGAGEDLTFSLLFDEIKEARRADPTYLPQGEWQQELKQSDWNQVVSLSSDALTEQSKDLQLAGWLCEGLAHKAGFNGIAFGLSFIGQLVDVFWDHLYPELEDDDLDERSARLSWLSDTLVDVVRTQPLLEGNGYALLQYEESRQVENQARNDSDAMKRALAEGKINDEMFQRSVVLTSTEFLQEKHTVISSTQAALNQLSLVCDQHFGAQNSPSFSSLLKSIDQCLDLTAKLLTERGASFGADDEGAPVDESETPDNQHEPTVSNTGMSQVQQNEALPLRTKPNTRDEAFEMLNEIAVYFKENEPQSPVPYLIKRAIKWGRMPLEDWLRDVIKDNGIIDNVRDTLGTLASNDND